MEVQIKHDTLICPNCNGEYLRHIEIRTFDREEDAPSGTAITLAAGHIVKVDTSSDLDGNPSARREGVSIEFACEGCGATPVLGIAQHKGQTLVAWI
jgi:hypothetical protein